MTDLPLRVIDTNVISYIFKADSRAGLYRPFLEGCRPVVSFQTLAELEVWMLRADWGPRRQAKLRDFVVAFAVISPTPAVRTQYAQVRTGCFAAGRPIDAADAWIAATALAIGCPLVTHNAADFAAVAGLDVLTGAE